MYYLRQTTTRDAQEELEAIGVSGGDQERAISDQHYGSSISSHTARNQMTTQAIAEATSLNPDELSE